MTLNLDTSIRFYRESIDIYKTFFNVHGYMSHQECMTPKPQNPEDVKK